MNGFSLDSMSSVLYAAKAVEWEGKNGRYLSPVLQSNDS